MMRVTVCLSRAQSCLSSFRNSMIESNCEGAMPLFRCSNGRAAVKCGQGHLKVFDSEVDGGGGVGGGGVRGIDETVPQLSFKARKWCDE